MSISIILLLVAAGVLLLPSFGGGDDEGEKSRRQQIFSIYPPNVFIADKDVNAIDELYVVG